MTESEFSASSRAYATLRDRILDGTYAPATMLGEATLAASLKMSRTPVRAALARLQDEGWIVIYPKRGALVQGLTEREVAELGNARLVLESTSVGRAPEPLRLRLADQMRASIVHQREAFASGDVREFIELTLAFHRGFVEAGGNSVLLDLYDRLADRQRFILFQAGERLLSRCEEIIAEHEDLTRLLSDGDAPGFAAALGEHIAETGVRPLSSFGFDGVITFPRLGI